MAALPLILFFTDFGYDGPYVGQMRLAVGRHAPATAVVNLMHDAPRFDPKASAYLLAALTPRLPPKSICVGVIDPGVGSTRAGVIVEADGRWFVGPGNGLFEIVRRRAKAARSWTLPEDPDAAPSFHGRDIFSPAAAHVARGVEPSDFGDEIDVDSLVRLREIGPLIKEDSIECRVVHVDHFGNAITNLSRDAMERMGRAPTHIRIESQDAPFAQTFGEVDEGKPVCYFNSTSYLELGVRNRSAAEYFELSQRDALHVVTRPI